MKTLTTDDYRRVRIPDAKPRQVFAYSADNDGTVTLTPIEGQSKEAFPPGSLLKYMTPERDKENEASLSRVQPLIHYPPTATAARWKPGAAARPSS